MAVESSGLESCSIGLMEGLHCHLLKFTKATGLVNFCELSSDDQELVQKRTGIPAHNISTICLHHKKQFLDRFASRFRSCCDPMKLHKKIITKSLHEITLFTSRKWDPIFPNIIPGQKICGNCRTVLDKKLATDSTGATVDTSTCTSSEDTSTDTESREQPAYDRQSTIEDVSSALQRAGVTPLKLHSLAKGSKKAYKKRKATEVAQSIGKKIKIAVPVSSEESSGSTEDMSEIQQKARFFDDIVASVRDKIASGASRSQILQMLTVFPQDFSRIKRMNLLGVTDHLARESIALREEKGMFALPAPRKGRKIAESAKKLVVEFYLDDEYSRMMPGQKDKISMGSKMPPQQKRLILCNIKELYAAFKKAYPTQKVGFSTFATLRPRWCVLAGSSGTHQVCVCTIHQNMSLLPKAGQLEKSYRELMGMCVCSDKNRDCMLLRCSNCPGVGNLETHLEQQFEDLEDNITYHYWKTTDRPDIMENTCTIASYINTVTKSFVTLIPHSYISKSQSGYLKFRKETLDRNSALVLMDFSENYTYKIQDEIQGYHWTHKSCTVHPVVCYYKNETGLQTKSLCFLTDDLTHDVGMVYRCQELTINHLKSIIPNLQTVQYFTDGCAAQYKNYKGLYNLCKHREEFGVNASISYFATSHGKSPCDGIGGTVKRETAKVSLQRTTRHHILSAKRMYQYCHHNLKGISFFLIEEMDLKSLRKRHQTRYVGLSTVTGTRAMHYFQPMSNSRIGAKRISFDEEYSFIWDFKTSKSASSPLEVSIGSFVAVAIDNDWFIGTITLFDPSQGDMTVSLLHPKGPGKSFHWPEHEDEQWVADRDVLCPINPPSPTEFGYEMEDSQITNIQNIFSQHKLRRYTA